MYLNTVSNIVNQQDRGNREQTDELSLANKVRSVSNKKRPKKLGLSLTMPQTTKGEMLGSGLCGEVRRDLAHEGFVLKSFSRFANEIAQKECSLFTLIYGEGSAEVIEEAAPRDLGPGNDLVNRGRLKTLVEHGRLRHVEDSASGVDFRIHRVPPYCTASTVDSVRWFSVARQVALTL